jgi:hypothetical protein
MGARRKFNIKVITIAIETTAELSGYTPSSSETTMRFESSMESSPGTAEFLSAFTTPEKTHDETGERGKSAESSYQGAMVFPNIEKSYPETFQTRSADSRISYNPHRQAQIEDENSKVNYDADTTTPLTNNRFQDSIVNNEDVVLSSHSNLIKCLFAEMHSDAHQPFQVSASARREDKPVTTGKVGDDNDWTQLLDWNSNNPVTWSQL